MSSQATPGFDEALWRAIQGEVELYTALMGIEPFTLAQRGELVDEIDRQGIVERGTEGYRFSSKDVLECVFRTIPESRTRDDILSAMRGMLANSEFSELLSVTQTDSIAEASDGLSIAYRVYDQRGNSIEAWTTPTKPIAHYAYTVAGYDGFQWPCVDLVDAVTKFRAAYRQVEGNLTIFTKDACQSCKMTQRALDKAGIPYLVANIAEEQEALGEFLAMGIQSAPVVEQAGRDVYGGMNPGKLKSIMATFASPTATPPAQVPSSVHAPSAPPQSRGLAR